MIFSLSSPSGFAVFSTVFGSSSILCFFFVASARFAICFFLCCRAFIKRSFSGVNPEEVDSAPNDLAPGDNCGLEIGMFGGGTKRGGIGGARLIGLDAKALPWDRGRGASTLGLRNEEERMPEGSEATGR
jgi:hypothetical protein